MIAQQNTVFGSPCAAEAARVLPVHGQVPSRGFSRASKGGRLS